MKLNLAKKILQLFKHLKLQTKLILSYILLIILPTLFIVNLLYNKSRNNIEESVVTYIRLYAAQVNYSIDNYIREIDSMIKTTFADYHAINILKNDDTAIFSQQPDLEDLKRFNYIENIIFRLFVQRPELKAIILIGSDGIPYSFKNLVIDYSALTAQPWFEQIKKSRRNLVISAAHEQNYIKNSIPEAATPVVVSLGRTINDGHGKPIGTIILNIDQKQLISFADIDSKNFDVNNYEVKIAVTDEYGNIIFDTLNQEERNFLSFDTLIKNSNNLSVQKILERQYHIIHNKSEYTKMPVFVLVPTNQLFSSMIEFSNMAMLIIAIGIACMVIISIMVSAYISNPLKQLEKTMKLVEKGDLNVTAQISSQDEIGSLARSFNIMISKIKEMVNTVYVAELREKQAQLSALQNQINPHFLHNTLESIRMKAIFNDDHEVAYMIKTLGKLFKFSLAKQDKTTTIKDELEHVKTYIELQNMRYNDKFELKVKLPNEMLESQIIKFIFQPIVENSIIHGFFNKELNCKITISGIIINNDIILRFEDNGVGIPEEKLQILNQKLAHPSYDKNINSKGHGIGLKNIRDRITLHYGEKYYLKLYSKLDKGTTVEICIPYKPKEDSHV